MHRDSGVNVNKTFGRSNLICLCAPFDLDALKSIGFFLSIRGCSISTSKVLSIILLEIIDENQKDGGV